MPETKISAGPSQISFWDLVKLSAGGTNSFGIILAAISIIRLISLQTKITLKGIYSDILSWYEKIFHSTLDNFIILFNKFNFFVKIPHIENSMKDFIIIFTVVLSVLFRIFRIMAGRKNIKIPFYYNALSYILPPVIIISASSTINTMAILSNTKYLKFNYLNFALFLAPTISIVILMALIGTSQSFNMSKKSVIFIFLFQFAMTAITVAGVFITSPYM